MPKMKTHKATAKRLRVTAGGKVVHRRPGSAHLLAKKSSRRKRKMAVDKEVSGIDMKRLKQLISPRGDL